jgi:signal transduction histidine kinase
LSEILRIPINRGLGDRIRWLIWVRWLILAQVAVVVLVADHWLADVLPAIPLFLMLLAIGCYNAIFLILHRRLVGQTGLEQHVRYRREAALMHTQVITDFFALTAVLHFSGGIENPFSAYYVLWVAIGSILMTKRSSYLYATVATAMWVGLLVLEATGVIPHYNLIGFRLAVRHREETHLVAESLVVASLNFSVAYLASSITQQLRRDEHQLFTASVASETRAAELTELNERLQELDRSRSLFTRLVTHELRAPVAAIQSYLQLILGGYVPADRLHEIVGKAELRAEDELERISDLLDLTRLQEPMGETGMEPTDAKAILHDVLDLMQARIRDKGLSLNLEVSADVPPVMASAEHVQRVWVNFVSNAIKYSPEGGDLTITLEDRGDVVRGSVRDTGIGMNREEMARLFEPFYRTKAAKAMSPHGTGLGLSIVKGIMERYGGRTWVESRPGRGSTFYFELSKAE